MPHQDQGRSNHTPAVVQVLSRLVLATCFGKLTFRKDCSWTPASLTQMALLWAWGEAATITDRFAAAQQVIVEASGGQHKSVSFQAFVKLLQRHSTMLLFALISHLQQQMQSLLADSYRIAGWVVLAVDGTRIDLPRTAAHQEAFAPRHCRTRRRGRQRRASIKKTTAPRLWLTTLWQVGTGLPWAWRQGAGTDSERDHLRRLQVWLPDQSLVTADAGYSGYDCWRALLSEGHHLLVRVGANVRLLRKLGYAREHAGRVYLWPDRQARREQPPLVLRLVVAHTGRHAVYLVTNVLSTSELSDQQVIEIYRARWGVEVFFRSFKRTLGCHKLRSTAPANAQLELDWALAALWAACLDAKLQQQAAGEDIARTSVAGVLRILRRGFHNTCLNMAHALSQALIDPYSRRNKTSRDYPRKCHKPYHISPPQINDATPEQIQLAQQLKRLTA